MTRSRKYRIGKGQSRWRAVCVRQMFMDKSLHPTLCKICGEEGIYPYYFCQMHLDEEKKAGVVVHEFRRNQDTTADTSGTYKVGQTVLVCIDEQYRVGDILRIVGDIAVVQLPGGKTVERELKSLVHLRQSTLERTRRRAADGK